MEKNTIGSRPKELFEDVIEEAEAQLEKDKALLKGALKEANLDVTPSTTFSEFYAALGPSRIDPQIAEEISTMIKSNKCATSSLPFFFTPPLFLFSSLGERGLLPRGAAAPPLSSSFIPVSLCNLSKL